MYTVDFIDALVYIYNIVAAVIIIFFCGYILLKTRKINRDLLKARLFLNNAVIQQNWMYISIAGASFALNTLLKLAAVFKTIGPYRDMIELTQIIFLVAFILVIYSWYLFISGSFQKSIIKS